MQNNFTFSTLILKTLASVFAGVVGSLLIVLFFILFSTALSPIMNLTENPDAYKGAVFIFLLLVMIFLTTLSGNVLSVSLNYLIEKEKYKRLTTSIYQTVVLSIIIFILFIPVYFIAKSIDISFLIFAVSLHIILSAQLTALILEIVSNYKYSLLGVYGTGFAIILSAGIMFFLYNILSNLAILLFFALPVVWGSIAIMQGIVTLTYNGISKIYDKDFLSIDSLYGEDYGNTIESEEDLEKVEEKDEEGAEFLRKQ